MYDFPELGHLLLHAGERLLARVAGGGQPRDAVVSGRQQLPQRIVFQQVLQACRRKTVQRGGFVPGSFLAARGDQPQIQAPLGGPFGGGRRRQEDAGIGLRAVQLPRTGIGQCPLDRFQSQFFRTRGFHHRCRLLDPILFDAAADFQPGLPAARTISVPAALAQSCVKTS